MSTPVSCSPGSSNSLPLEDQLENGILFSQDRDAEQSEGELNKTLANFDPSLKQYVQTEIMSVFQ